MRRGLFLLILVLVNVIQLSAQASQNEPKGVILSKFTYGAQLPAGTLKERFGSNFIAGGGVDWQWGPKNWVLGVDAQYIFGNDREVADIPMRERGFYVGLTAGRVFPVNAGQSSRAGWRFNFGIGMLQHKIRIQDDPQRSVVQLTDVYKKGYDRLSNGLALQQYFGYQALSKDRRSNFMAGFEFMQGFTQSRRSFDFATQGQDGKKRIDLLLGIRVGWILPFYADKAEDIYY